MSKLDWTGVKVDSDAVVIARFFGQDLKVAATEIRKLSSNDRAELAAMIRVDQGLAVKKVNKAAA